MKTRFTIGARLLSIIFLLLTVVTVEAKNFETACKKNDAAACEKLGQTSFDQKKWEEAEAHFDKACDLGSIDSCRMKAHAWGKQGNEMMLRNFLEVACSAHDSKKACEEAQNYKQIFDAYKEDARAFELSSKQKHSEEYERRQIHEDKLEKERVALAEKEAQAEKIRAEKDQKQFDNHENKCLKDVYASCAEAGKLALKQADFSTSLSYSEKACDNGIIKACTTAMDAARALNMDAEVNRISAYACSKGQKSACEEARRASAQAERKRQEDVETAVIRAAAQQERESLRRQQLEQDRHDQLMEQQRRKALIEGLQEAAKAFAPPPPPKRTRCETRGYGNSVETVCEEQ